MRACRIKNPRFPHRILVYREVLDNPFAEESERVVLYDGCGRSFTNTTTDGDKHIVENMRKCALPVKVDEVENILANDTIEVWIGEKIHEYGLVTDIKPANLGSEILWKYARN